MLPEIRQNEHLFSVPVFDIDKNDIDCFLEELIGFHQNFSDCFHRSESRGHFYNYMAGQFSELERKSIEPIALNIKDGKVRAMQRFISDAEWDDPKIMSEYRNMVKDDLGSLEGVLIFDESGFAKKGNDSVGVAKQYCGSIGKVDNCQVGVFAAYASPYGYALIDKQIYIPEKWFGDDFRAKRVKCKLPENTEFKTKPRLAAKMLNDVAAEDIIPFKYVLADSIYGENPDFIDTVESMTGKIYFVSVGADRLCQLRQPITLKKQYKYKGEIRTEEVLSTDAKTPISVKEPAKNINDCFWYRRTVSEGAKGPITYEFTKREVVLSNKGLPQKTVWLIIKRTLSENHEYSYYISNAPVSTRLGTFVWLSGLRWAIEQCFEETKSELGLDHYQVRKYTGWHHHISVCMPAHFFLWHLKIRLEKKAPSITISQIRCLIQVVLPLRPKQVNVVIEKMRWIHERNHRAYLSHRKRRLNELSGID